MSENVFEAVIVPHRSLGAVGTRWLVAVVLALSGIVCTFLFWLGAWPVIGFNGAEVALALVLLRRNVRMARTHEVLVLSHHGLRIVATDARGRRSERTIGSGWLRAILEEQPGRAPSSWLASGGRRYEVAAQLGASEKRDLARALQEAFHRLQNPLFDNPQLRPS